MVLRRWLAVLLAVFVMSACGGGGDSRSGGDDESFSISFDRNHVEATFAEDSPVPDITVIATTHGTPSGNVFIGASTPAGENDPNIEPIAFDSSRVVHIQPKAGLARGKYTGTLLMLVCADVPCTKHYAGSRFSLSYTFVVTASLRVSPQTIDFEHEAGTTQSLDVSVALPEGESSYTATAADSWATIEQITSSGFRVTVPSRALGHYSTTIEVASGTYRRTISVNQWVKARTLKVDKPSLSLNAVSGAGASTPVAVTQLAEGAADFTVATGAYWLSVNNVTPGGFEINVSSLPSGTYKTEVVVFSANDRLVIPVSYTVAPPTGGDRYLNVKARNLTFAALEGGVSVKESVGLARPSWNPDVTVDVSYNSGSGWLTSGTGPDGDLQLWANAAGLTAGVYQATATITVAFPFAYFDLPVTLTVGAGLTLPEPRVVVIDSESTAASLKGSIPVVGDTTAGMVWTATSSQPWLRLTRSSGGPGSTIDYEIDAALALAVPAYTDVPAAITVNVSATGASATTGVILRRELAEVSYAGPGNVVSGLGSTIIVRGRGFDRFSNPATRFVVGDVTPISVTRLSATSLRVTLPAMSAGDKTIAISNALGAATEAAKLQVLDAHTYIAAALSTGGVPSAVLHDPLRRQLFVANTTLNSIQRFRESAGSWARDELKLPGLDNIGLSPDGAVLVATVTQNMLYLIDPVTLTVKDVFTAPSFIRPAALTGHGLAITNDGKVWLNVFGGWNTMVVFDIRTHMFSPVYPDVYRKFTFGPQFLVSRDGERLVARESPYESPMYYMDSSLGVWHDFSYGPFDPSTRFYGFDDTGSRLASAEGIRGVSYGGNDLAWTWAATIPDRGWSQTAGVLSPDGKRYYVYAQPADWLTATTPLMPRVYVFDASPVSWIDGLPLLGQFELPDLPTCYTYLRECSLPAMSVSIDGSTLFIAGKLKLLVVPVPTLTPTAGGRRAPVMQRWVPK